MAQKRKKKKKALTTRKRNSPRGWADWPIEKLLDTRICELNLKIKGSILEPQIKKLYGELKRRKFTFRPHFWLSDEWYCPDEVPGVAIPFYLVHSRLRRIEKKFMLEVEGGDKNWCMKLLRHETAHALLNAYQLHKRKDWREQFGDPNKRYPETYLPHAYSKKYVNNLPNWYAQAHPHEDWAETFAVWLKPNSDWRNRYFGWPAIRKLEYVNNLMQEIRHTKPKRKNTRTEFPVEKMRITLREHYQKKLELYGEDHPEFFDNDLRILFPEVARHRKVEPASAYIKRNREEILITLQRWTHEYCYRVNEVLNDMIARCDKLGLTVALTDREIKHNLIAFLTTLVLNKLHSDGFHITL